MTFWKLAAKYLTDPEAASGVTPLPLVSPESANNKHPLRPGLRAIAGIANIYDAAACAELADYLAAQKITAAVYDFEPSDTGDRKGYTPENRTVCRCIVGAFAERGVKLSLYDVPPVAAAWTDAMNGGPVLLPSLYTFGDDPGEWHNAYLAGVARMRKAFPGRQLIGWISPFKGGGTSTEAVSPEMWDVQLRFVAAYCDSGVAYACRIGADGKYLAWDSGQPWWRALRKAAKQ